MASRTQYDAVAASVLTDVQVDSLAKGWIGYNATSTDTTGVTSGSDITGLAVTVNVLANRLIQVAAFCHRVGSTVANDRVIFTVAEGATTLQQAYSDVGANALVATGGVAMYVVSDPFVPSAGTHTYKATGLRAAGTGNISFLAAATAKSWISVVDLGPSS